MTTNRIQKHLSNYSILLKSRWDIYVPLGANILKEITIFEKELEKNFSGAYVSQEELKC